MAHEHRLRVIIVGGGIAGLVAARVLREKHDVTILERSESHNQVGASFGLAPNGMRILRPLGFDEKRARVQPIRFGRTFDMNHKLLATHDYSSFLGGSGEDAFLIVHRVDIWWELRRLATAPSAELGIEGNRASIEFDVLVTSIDPMSGVVALSDGRTIESDLVIGENILSSSFANETAVAGID